MSAARIRFVVGTARLGATARLRRVRGRLRRHPRRTAVVPRPAPARRTAECLRLSHVLTACDLNARYLRLWPIAQRAWETVLGVQPVLVLVASSDDVPEELRGDPAVRVFDPVPGLHTTFQAQCIRVLYPALLETEGAVITSDVDMVPLGPRYFHRPLRRVDSRHFVCYRDVLVPIAQLPICYNAALPATWASIFHVHGIDDVRERLQEWAEGVDYSGIHGGAGWSTDQQILYRILVERGRRARDVWILDDDFTGFRRLERAYVEKWGTLSEDARRRLEKGAFSDFHLLRGDSEHATLNEVIVDVAIESLRRRGEAA